MESRRNGPQLSSRHDDDDEWIYTYGWVSFNSADSFNDRVFPKCPVIRGNEVDLLAAVLILHTHLSGFHLGLSHSRYQVHVDTSSLGMAPGTSTRTTPVPSAKVSSVAAATVTLLMRTIPGDMPKLLAGVALYVLGLSWRLWSTMSPATCLKLSSAATSVTLACCGPG